ncbi:hypothetical protein PROFUN_13294 [Planoprotostelium fungivorum]|uniref:SH2 domain-containing protein n=1 Tax=Planoprotostelium fungivorum TaxID=1890364 RepID=A0A2P6N4Q2_9EUKA|nr:hypothetical protein PROFUN_13294 [Planoprotostelium fungivorum]
MERINSKSKVKQQSEIYRDSTLGQCLSTAAIELREENLLTEDQMEQIMRDFDVGELLSYNYSDSQWTMIAANSTFRVGLETIWVDCVKLLVQDGNSASPLFSSLSSPRGAASPAKHRRPKSSAATGTETEVSKVHKVDIKWKDIEIINDRNRSTFKGRWIHSETSHVVLIRKCTENPTDSSYVKEQLRLFRALPPHPHVGRVFGMIKRGPAGEKQSYTVEEVVEFQGDFVGNDLDSLIQKDIKWAALKEPQKILLLWEVAWALWQLHSAGLIHGNLNLHTVRGGSNGIKLTEYSFTSQNFVHTDGKEESRSAKLDVLQFGHFIINLFEKTAQASEEDPQPVVIPFPIQSIMDPCLAEVPMGLRKIAFECSQVNPDQRPSASRIFRTFEEEFLRGRIAMSKVEPTGLPFGLHLTVLTDENGNRVGSRDMTLPATLPAQAKELFKLRELVDRLNTQNMEKDRQTQHHLAQQLKNQRMMNELQGQLNTLKVQLEHKNVERNESKINVNSSVDQGMHEQLQREKIAGAETEGAIQLELMQLQMAQQARSEKLEQIQEARDKCNQEIEELKQQQEVKEREYEEQVKRKKEEHVRIDENHKQRLAQMDHDFAESHKNLVQAKPALSPNTSLYRKSLDPSAVALLQQQQQHQIAQLQGLNRSNSGGNAVQQVVTPVTLPMTTVQYPPATSQYPPATSQYPPGASPYPPVTSQYPPGASPYPPTQVTPHYPPTTPATHPVQPPAQQTVHHDTLLDQMSQALAFDDQLDEDVLSDPPATSLGYPLQRRDESETSAAGNYGRTSTTALSQSNSEGAAGKTSVQRVPTHERQPDSSSISAAAAASPAYDRLPPTAGQFSFVSLVQVFRGLMNAGVLNPSNPSGMAHNPYLPGQSSFIVPGSALYNPPGGPLITPSPLTHTGFINGRPASMNMGQPLMPISSALAPAPGAVTPNRPSSPLTRSDEFIPSALGSTQRRSTVFIKAGEAESKIRATLDRDVDWLTFRNTMASFLEVKGDREKDKIHDLKYILAPKGIVSKSTWDNFIQWFSPLVPSYAEEPEVVVLDESAQTGDTRSSVPFYTLKDVLNMVKYKWFWGFLDPSETQKILLKHPTGTFLFRFSSQPKCYTLSVSNGGQVGHWRIRSQKTVDTQHFWIDERQYTSLSDIMQVHMSEVLKVNTAKSTQQPVRLTVSAERQEAAERVYDSFAE